MSSVSFVRPETAQSIRRVAGTRQGRAIGKAIKNHVSLQNLSKNASGAKVEICETQMSMRVGNDLQGSFRGARLTEESTDFDQCTHRVYGTKLRQKTSFVS